MKTARYRSKKTGKFVSKAAWKRWPGKVVRKFYNTKRKSDVVLEELGLESPEQKRAFKRTLQKFTKNRAYRDRTLRMMEDVQLGLRPDKEASYDNLKERMQTIFDDFGDNSRMGDFRTIRDNFFRMQNTKRVSKLKQIFPAKTVKRTQRKKPRMGHRKRHKK